jgi:hypothetical protein
MEAALYAIVLTSTKTATLSIVLISSLLRNHLKRKGSFIFSKQQ